ncbi:MAG: VRR-NUC domain-containing protein [SAR324 cluster bacterium]|nr:VRR-NUC domain-containing protein [SAR324 cluster bacterium]
MQAKVKVSESNAQKAIIQWLGCHRGVFAFRVNNMGVPLWTNGEKRFRHAPDLGLPDIICCYQGRMICLEVKSSTGKQSKHQLEFQRKVEWAGCEYYVVRSIEDVDQALKAKKVVEKI